MKRVAPVAMAVLAVFALAALAGHAAAQEFPAQPVRVLVPFAAGGVLESSLRAIGERFRESTGQPLLVEARPGGGGIVAAQALQAARADGHTALLATQAILAVNPHIYRKLPYDPQRDFAPVSELLNSPFALTVHPGVPAASVAEFIAWVKANPGKVSYGSIAPGTPSHFLGVLINLEYGTDLTHVPYKGSPTMLPDLLAGRVQAGFLSLDTIRTQVDSGKLRALAVTGATRAGLLPATPTMAEAGFPRMQAQAWSGIVVPAATPDAVVRRLHAELVRAMAVAEVRAELRKLGMEPVAGTPAEFAARIRSESERWARVVKSSGFSAEN